MRHFKKAGKLAKTRTAAGQDRRSKRMKETNQQFRQEVEHTSGHVMEMMELIRDNRVSYICAADYSPDKEIDRLVRTIIDKIEADHKLSKFYKK